MKIFVICSVAASIVFFGIFMQLNMEGRDKSTTTSAASAKSEPKKEPRAKFPDDLVPAAQAKPVEKAAVYKPGPEPHKMTILTPRGELHAWHEFIPEDWQADRVEETELVVVVSKQRKTLIQHVVYPKGEPPIDRVAYEVEVSVVEAKTGAVLDNRIYRNLPREIRRVEAFRTTLIGRVVEWPLVYNWVANKSKVGFSDTELSLPIEIVVD